PAYSSMWPLPASSLHCVAAPPAISPLSLHDALPICVYSRYAQSSQFIEGRFLSKNVEWFVQDNWKVNPKLTFDYGLRFVYQEPIDRKSTRLNSSHVKISYAVFCLKKKKRNIRLTYKD